MAAAAGTPPAAAAGTAAAAAPYCIVTGGNAGLGKETTAGLMATGAHVVMACRNMQTCEATRAELQARGLPGSCECARLDLSSRASVTQFAAQQGERLRAQGRPLAVLVNNAGVMGSSITTAPAADSVAPGVAASDPHLLVNHLGPFLLTNLLAPHLVSGSRVVNVSSRAHYAGDLQLTAEGGGGFGPCRGWFRQYARSKLANVLHTAELQQRLRARGVIATSVSPGFVATNIFASLPPLLRGPIQAAASLLGRTPAQGAETFVFAATSPTLGADPAAAVPLFLHDCKPMVPSAQAQDEQLAADLWAASSAAVGWEEQ